jgi:hypothetical protein
MNTTTHSSNRNMAKTIFGKLSILMDEAVWQFALIVVVATAIVDGAMSMGGGSIA